MEEDVVQAVAAHLDVLDAEAVAPHALDQLRKLGADVVQARHDAPHAMLSRRFMPPEKFFTGSCARSASAVHSSARSTRARISARGTPCSRPNVSRFSRAVSNG